MWKKIKMKKLQTFALKMQFILFSAAVKRNMHIFKMFFSKFTLADTSNQMKTFQQVQ